MNFKGEVKWDDTKPDGQFRKPSDNSKLKTYLPNFKFTPIYEGLSESISYFLNKPRSFVRYFIFTLESWRQINYNKSFFRDCMEST